MNEAGCKAGDNKIDTSGHALFSHLANLRLNGSLTLMKTMKVM
jgi:hypothetical protein